jgi:hypothetical protein
MVKAAQDSHSKHAAPLHHFSRHWRPCRKTSACEPHCSMADTIEAGREGVVRQRRSRGQDNPVDRADKPFRASVLPGRAGEAFLRRLRAMGIRDRKTMARAAYDGIGAIGGATCSDEEKGWRASSETRSAISNGDSSFVLTCLPASRRPAQSTLPSISIILGRRTSPPTAKPLWYGVRRWDADHVPHNPPVMPKPITPLGR